MRGDWGGGMAGNPSNRGVQLALGERMYMLMHKPLIREGSALSWLLPVPPAAAATAAAAARLTSRSGAASAPSRVLNCTTAS